MIKKGKRLLSLLFVVSFLYSCDLYDFYISEKPVFFSSDNVYKDLDMDVFRGFVDKMTVRELLDRHGQPDTILDAKEVATIDGYEIYEYSFPDGCVDCYVPIADKYLEDSVKKGRLVDYIYYEPKKSIILHDFILNDSLLGLVPTGESVVYFIDDPFHNVVRFRLDRKNKNEILNVALNDISMFEQKNSLVDAVAEFDEQRPISLGDLGSITKIEYERKQLNLIVSVSDSNLNFKRLESDNPLWAELVTIRIFDKSRGICKWLTDDVIREEVDVSICLFSGDEYINKVVDSAAFNELFGKGYSNIDRLKWFTQFENLVYPYTVYDMMTCEKLEIHDGYLVIPYTFESVPDNFKIDKDKIKRLELKQLQDPENPERDNFSLCFICNYGVRKIYRFKDFEEIVIDFSPKEVKDLMKTM
ncbi:MAG: hypothetical protein IJ887_12845 [Prevotella sp.]|nr:hypothetical protein [Prevotella sp.]